MALTLIHAPMSRSQTIRWILEELKADYVIQEVSIRRRDGSGGEDPNNPHPHKQVPALVHDGQVVWEQSAIALYLSELYPASTLVRAPGHSERGAFVSWLVWYGATVESALIAAFDGLLTSDAGKKRQYDRVVTLLTDRLGETPYLMGDMPTLPDFLLVGALNFARPLLPDSEIFDAFAEHMNSRPVARRLQGAA